VLWPKGFTGSFEWISAFIGLAAFIDFFPYKVPAIPAVGACAAVALVLTLSKHI
jgi:chromate transporter